MKNIVLTGFMGTGKTSVGRELSRMLGWKFIDVDQEIVKAKGMTINAIFSTNGESVFREIEAEAINRVCKKNNLIISTGGGAVLKQENIDILKETGTMICLTAAPETILKRNLNSNERPLLKVEDPLQKIRELLEFRRPFYEKADMMIDTESKTPLQIAQEILEKIK